MELILRQKQAKDYSLKALKRTTDLLDLNPEYYTIWNYRRHILLRGLFSERYAILRLLYLSDLSDLQYAS